MNPLTHFKKIESGRKEFDDNDAVDESINQEAALEQEISKCKMKIQIKPDFLNISLDTFIKAFVEDNAVFSWKRYHESKGDLNLNVGPWATASNTLGSTREMRFFKPVNLPGTSTIAKLRYPC